MNLGPVKEELWVNYGRQIVDIILVSSYISKKLLCIAHHWQGMP